MERIEAEVELLEREIKHYLLTTMAVTLEEATSHEFYRAFSFALREKIMLNWTATQHRIQDAKARVLHYLCMEYMPGRLLSNNITSMNAQELVQRLLKKMNRNLSEVLRHEPDPGLGNGGLGRLASCFLDSLATQDYPAIAYGLRYQYGIFDQEIWDGVQMERPEMWLLHENPWEFRRDNHAVSVYYGGRAIAAKNRHGVEAPDLADYDEVRALAYDLPIIGYKEAPNFNVVTLRLWSTKESPRNFQLQRYNAGQLDQAAENTSLTDVLYPNDNHEMGKRMRLKQEFLLVSASLQDLIHNHFHVFSDMSSFADKVRIHVNDTHPSLVFIELLRLLIKQHDMRWQEAWEIVKTVCNFTNHTILRESLEEWNEQRMHQLLPRQYELIQRLNNELCSEIRRKYPGNEEKVRALSIIEGGQVKMAHLAIVGSHRVNGVAALHSDILKQVMFKDFSDLYPEKFVNVTNGVTQRRWLLHCNPALAELISRRIGRGWITNFKEISKLAAYASDPETQTQFLEIKRANKRKLIDYFHTQDPLRNARGKPIDHFSVLGEHALFDVQIKRVHEYKRQLMNALHTIMLYHELHDHPDSHTVARMVIFAGKAAPGYAMAKAIIRLIYCIARKIDHDARVSPKLQVAFVENYNVSCAELLIPAADLSEQISTAGMEASGTGNMKLSINGSLTIGTEDGANVEMHAAVTDKWWPFSFGATADENRALISTYKPKEIYARHPAIKRAIDSLTDRTFAESEEEHQIFQSIAASLLETDRFLVLNDLPAYHAAQKKVETLFSTPSLWAEYALHNIASMGQFSSDESIHNYAQNIWNLTGLHAANH
jgi:starch phosphorylase